MSLLLLGATTASADYYVGERLTVSDVQDGDLVILEAASTTVNYGYYLKETSDGFFWKEGIDNSCVWRLVSTGTANTYYFQNVSTGNYIAGKGDETTTCIVSADQTSASAIELQGWSSSWYAYSAAATYPKGWDQKSTILYNTSEDYNLGNRVFDNAKPYGIFLQDGVHCCPWNIFKISTTSGTPFGTYTGEQTSHSNVQIDGLYYNLNAFATPSGEAKAIFTTSNKNSTSASLTIPATVTYGGLTFKVTGFANGAFQGGKFSSVTFVQPTNITTIGDWNFAECNNIVEFNVPEGVTTIAANAALSRMNSLETITLPSTIARIENWSFYSDPALTTITFENPEPPTFAGSKLFGGTTVPGNIYIVVPTEAAVTAYTNAIATYNSANGTSVAFKGIVTKAQYEAQYHILLLKQKLQDIVDMGVGVVMGIKDQTSYDAAVALLAGSPTVAELETAIENYKMPLTTGYYRISYPKNYQGVLGGPFMYFGSDLLLNADRTEAEAKTDYSTVFKVTVVGEAKLSIGSGYEVTMESQGGYRPYYNGSYTDQKIVGLGNSAKAYIVRPSGGFDDGSKAVVINVGKTDGTFHNNYYLIKTADGDTQRAIKANYNTSNKQPTSAQAYVYPATDITITLHAAESNYWGTLYVPFDVQLPAGNEAFVGKLGEKSLTLTSIGQNIPAGTPVIIKGNAASITADIVSGLAAITDDNDLQGQYLAAAAADETKLALGQYNGKVGFYKYADALGANKAYVVVNGGSPSAGFEFVFDDDDVTGISNVQSSMLNAQSYYDLYGRKVATPQKGQLYIQNGKVVRF
ncbi:MAG: leucine-rich repeat domain-containing protein [Bacteroidaceae bacterium]|nr:leucine-rich repeat domain-containing protein [Bacteroidaceae bacterium]